MRDVSILRCERLDETIHAATIDGGLRVFVLPKTGHLKKFAVYTTRYGSIDNEFRAPGEPRPRRVPEGIAHFLEHKLFEDAEGATVFDRFARLGAQPNAATSYTQTAYHFSCTEHFDESLDLLVRFVGTPHLTPEQIEKERKVIAQEIRMYDDSPGDRGFRNLLRALYHCHPVREDITGTVESIAGIDRAELERCYRTFYRPSNMALFCAGDVRPEAIFACVERALAACPARELGEAEAERVYPVEPAGVAREHVEESLDIALPSVLAGWKDPDPAETGAALLDKELELVVALDIIFGRSSDFYQERYESGLIDASFYWSEQIEQGFGYIFISGETERPEELAAAVKKAMTDARGRKPSPGDVGRIRNKLYGRFLRTFNYPESVANNFVARWFLGTNLFDYLDALDRITPEAVERRFASFFHEGSSAVSIVHPSRGGAKPRKTRQPAGGNGDAGGGD